MGERASPVNRYSTGNRSERPGMKITVENWKSVERIIRDSGIQDAMYDAEGILRTVVTKKGERFEFTFDVVEELRKAGLIEVRLGRPVGPMSR